MQVKWNGQSTTLNIAQICHYILQAGAYRRERGDIKLRRIADSVTCSAVQTLHRLALHLANNDLSLDEIPSLSAFQSAVPLQDPSRIASRGIS
jgi:hypothetical protein